MLTTYVSGMMDVAALVSRATVLAGALTALSEAIKQPEPQTRLVISVPWMVLDAVCVPSLLVPTQLIPAPFLSTLTSALNTSLGVWTPPLVETLAISILIGSFALGSAKVWLAPGCSVKLSRW